MHASLNLWLAHLVFLLIGKSQELLALPYTRKIDNGLVWHAEKDFCKATVQRNTLKDSLIA